MLERATKWKSTTWVSMACVVALSAVALWSTEPGAPVPAPISSRSLSPAATPTVVSANIPSALPALTVVRGSVTPVEDLHDTDVFGNFRLPHNSETELTCSDKPPAQRPPKHFNASDPVALFKNATAWAFKQWWDWDAKCEAPKDDDDARMRVRFDEETQEYVMENVCFSAVGPLSGYKPLFSERVRILHELENVKATPLAFNKFYNNVIATPTAPSCFVKANLILLGEDWASQNNVHSFYRFAHVALMRRFHFPRQDDPPHRSNSSRPMNQTTVIGHIWLDSFNGNSSDHRYYFPLMGDAWFSVAASEKLARRLAPLLGDETEIRRRMATSLCFRKAHIAHGCVKKHCSGNRIEYRRDSQFADAPGRRYKLSFLTPRTQYDRFVLNWLRGRFARCVGINAKAFSNATHPGIVFQFRSTNRRFKNFASQIGFIASDVSKNYNASALAIVEPRRLSPNDVVKLHINADILVGVFGGGLGWVFLMPRAAVLLELVGDYGCPGENLQVTGSGFFRPAECEYAGTSAACGVRQFHHPLGPRIREAYSVSDDAWRYLFKTASCALRWQPGFVSSLPSDRDVFNTTFLRAAYRNLIAECERNLLVTRDSSSGPARRRR